MTTTEPGVDGKFFLIAGPSGVGKSTLAAALVARMPRCVAISPVTTRPRRLDDVEGKPYHFVTDAEFDALEQSGELLETCDYCAYRYGMVRAPILRALQESEIPIQKNILYQWPILREKYPALQVRSIFLVPPSLEILEHRIRTRSPLSEDQIRLRMASAKVEMETAHLADLQVMSEEGQQEKVYETVQRYILSELQPNRL